jgi:molybdopterin molybdotransferase
MQAPLPLEEAQARLLALAAPLPAERLAIGGTLGRYLFQPLRARRSQPAADLSAMDGYAVAHDSLAGPWQVTGESAAGHPFAGTLHSGEAVRISTGAVLPCGAGVVVVQEDCLRDGSRLTVTGTPPLPPDRHIRRQGTDFTAGAELLPAGTRIGPAQLALAISAGHSHLAVRRLPRVTIIDSGDELAPPGTPCPVHNIPAGNGAMLAAMAGALPCRVSRIGPVPDDLPRLMTALAKTRGADIIVTSGGASVGDHDLIGPALAQWGAEIDFWKVAIKPGKPLLVARRGHQIVLGLPGNPVASLVTGFFFLLPLLRTLLGAGQCLPRPFIARLGNAMPANGERREFVRGQWDGTAIATGTSNDSGALASMARCNVVVDRAANSSALVAGAEVSAYLLESAGIA